MAKEPFVTARERDPLAGKTDKRVDLGTSSVYDLPGYTDRRIIREHAAARGEDAGPLPYRFHVVNVERIDGRPDNRQLAEFKKKGYRPVKWDEGKNLGVDFEASAYQKGADGTVRLNEGMLMVADADAAEKERKRIEDLNALQAKGYDDATEQAVENFNARVGLTGDGASKPVFGNQ